MAATLDSRSAGEVATACVAALQAAQWTPSGGAAEAAFEVVKLFDALELSRAFEEVLVAQKSRVAFVVMTGEAWESEPRTALRLSSRRTLNVSVIVSDRVLADRQSAIWGNSTHPGSDRLKDLAIAAVVGRIQGAQKPAVAIVESAELMFVERLEDTGKTLPGRAAHLIEFAVEGGSLTAALGSGPAH